MSCESVLRRCENETANEMCVVCKDREAPREVCHHV